MASYQYVYTMSHLTKTFPGGREVLKDVTLAFLPGAKIGVLGVNGAGKSTLMKIMSGEEKEYNGEAWAAEAAEVGILHQEPELDPSKDVYGNVLEGMRETHELLKEFEEISLKFAEPMDDDEMNALIEKQGELQEKIDAVGGWDLERKLEIAMDALRCPPKDANVSKLSGGERRRVALCRLLLRQPDLLLLDEP
ncbi:MAG: ATP-binding cassette domain-containing protein, partial [Rhodospirillaceae bacterium]|nr:ATP-binding cassette domain-containing protein [Rhodospirillaceae bacterium]